MKGTSFTNSELLLIFNATTFANVAINATSTPLTSLYLSLHTANPGAAGSQTTSECAYTGYARQALARTSSGFTVSGKTVTLASAVSFPAAPTDATETAMFWGVGSVVSGAGVLFYSGPIGTNLGVGTATAADVITIPGLTGVAVNDRITFDVPTGGTVPTGITAGTVYYVLTVSTNDITISATQGGAAVNVTAAGQVMAYKVTPIALGSGVAVTPQLTTGTTITEL